MCCRTAARWWPGPISAPSPTWFASSASTRSAPPVGGETTVGNAGAFGCPQVAVLPDGRYAVAWLSSDSTISFQRFLANGTPDGLSTIATANANSNYCPIPFDFIGLVQQHLRADLQDRVRRATVSATWRCASSQALGTVGAEIIVDNPAGLLEQGTPYLAPAAATTSSSPGMTAPPMAATSSTRTFTLTGGSPSTEATVNTTTAGAAALLADRGADHVRTMSSSGTTAQQLRGQLMTSSAAAGSAGNSSWRWTPPPPTGLPSRRPRRGASSWFTEPQRGRWSRRRSTGWVARTAAPSASPMLFRPSIRSTCPHWPTAASR
jgi:hypothetical protein